MSEPVFVPAEEAAAMGVSREAYDELVSVVGHLPTMEELGTLLAMWQSNGKQQSLYGWLCGQRHTVVRESYLYDGDDETHRSIQEPRVQECVTIAKQLCGNARPSTGNSGNTGDAASFQLERSHLIYLVGRVSTEFLDSEYGRRYLHISSQPRAGKADDDADYIDLILSVLRDNHIVSRYAPVGAGGLFRTLASGCGEKVGFDILTCREIRLDAFLFGEEEGRFVATLKEADDDTFLSRLDEARVDCCFLGRTTKGRVLVDGMDFGPATEYCLSDA